MWVKWTFFVAGIAVAGYYVVAALVPPQRGSRGGAGGRWVGGYELSHLGMALGMAGMFSPLGDPVPRLVWLAVFGMAAAWFAACLLQAGTPTEDHPSAPADSAAHHHLVANLAMLFMVAGGHRHHGAGAVGGAVNAGHQGSGHEGHSAAAGGTGWIEGPIGTVLIVVLAGYFAVHTVRSLRVLFSAATRVKPTPRAAAAGIGSVAVVVAPSAMGQAQAACHVVMGTAMVVMFGLML